MPADRLPKSTINLPTSGWRISQSEAMTRLPHPHHVTLIA